jgi:hypothetical protein
MYVNYREQRSYLCYKLTGCKKLLDKRKDFPPGPWVCSTDPGGNPGIPGGTIPPPAAPISPNTVFYFFTEKSVQPEKVNCLSSSPTSPRKCT